MSSIEQQFNNLRINFPQYVGLWNLLWTPHGFTIDVTFEENISRVLPEGEVRENVLAFLDGKRWDLSELSDECIGKFDFFMMDWRSGICFVRSKQLDQYVEMKFNLDLSGIFTSRKNLNDTNFEWSDVISKANEFLDEVPTGADPVMYLLFTVWGEIEEDIYSTPVWYNVLLHGEDACCYYYLPYSHWGFGVMNDSIPLLVALCIEDMEQITSSKWTRGSIDMAINCIECELSAMDEGDDRYIEESYRESLEILESLDTSWDVTDRIGISCDEYPSSKIKAMTVCDVEEQGIYCLQLNNGKYYIGKTEDTDQRKGNGSEWIKLHGVIGEIHIRTPRMDDLDEWERCETIEMARANGIRNVRGHLWTSIILPREDMVSFEAHVCDRKKLCMSCGKNHTNKNNWPHCTEERDSWMTLPEGEKKRKLEIYTKNQEKNQKKNRIE